MSSDNQPEPVVTQEQAIAFIEAIGCHGDDWISEADLIASELSSLVTAAVARREAEIVAYLWKHGMNNSAIAVDEFIKIKNGGGA